MSGLVASGNPAWIVDQDAEPIGDEYDADLELEPMQVDPESATVAVLRLRYRAAEAGTELTMADLVALRAELRRVIAAARKAGAR